MGKLAITIEQFLAMTPAERGAMPLKESSMLWFEVMARDAQERTRLGRVEESHCRLHRKLGAARTSASGQ